MFPILERYGPFFLYSFSVALVVGVAAALCLTAWLAHRAHGQRQFPGWMDGAVLAAVIGLIGGRIGYVVAHSSYFAENPAEAWQLWHGGLSYHGALLAGLAALWMWCRWQQRAFLHYAGLFAPGLALLSAAGWAACWLEGCAYGVETLPGLLTASLPDEFGVYAGRYQTQAIGFILSLGVFGILLGLWRGRTAGGLFWAALFSLSVIHGLVSRWRGDPAPYFLSWRVDVWLDFGLAVLALLCYGLRKRAMG
jgi:phosphatidylglycerol:prolipoprotein diacylglycerol transferase